MNRRGFLQACLASATAPYVVTTAGVLMPVKKIITVSKYFPEFDLDRVYLIRSLESIVDGRIYPGAYRWVTGNWLNKYGNISDFRFVRTGLEYINGTQ